MSKKKLITSALPYVNNVPHLGNIIGSVLSADVYARFCRSRGYETRYVCGTDEYGTATENKAREEGLTPREICDKYHSIHVSVYQDFNISFDVFGRTSTPEQTEIAQAIFKDLDARDLVSEQSSERAYCNHDQMFLADRYVEGTCPHCGYSDARGDQCDNCGKLLEPEALIDPRCKICGNPPTVRETHHLYLDLDKLQGPLFKWFQESSQQGAWTWNAVKTTQGWLERGLQPRPITRDLKWGIPVPKPGFEDKVFYVWFDATIGYISITAKGFEDWRDWWQRPDEVELYQFMAKDNIPFHTVIFPASLLGTGKPWTMLHHINSTEYLNYEDTKFSKSRNIGVFGTDVRETGIPTDLWRFYLLLVRPEQNDSSFSWEKFFERVNADFIDNIANLVNRSLVFLHKNFAGKLCERALEGDHGEAIVRFQEACEGITQSLEAVKLRDSLRQILALGNLGNKFFQDMAPWHRIKTEPEHAHATVTVLAYLIRSLAVALEPYMPETARRMLSFLRLEKQNWTQFGLFADLQGHQIGKAALLYQKLDVKQAAKFQRRFSGDRPSPGQFHLTAAEITAVKSHPHADHLYVLTVDAGEGEARTLVAGLVKYYTPDQLLQRKVIILANLEPAVLNGVESQGMVMAVQKRKNLELLDGGDLKPGTVLDGTLAPGQITIEAFKNAPFSVADHQVLFDEDPLTLGGYPLKTKELASGKLK